MKILKWGFIGLMVMAGVTAGMIVLALKQPVHFPGDSYRMELKRGASASSLALKLEQQGLIPNRYLLRLYLKASGKEQALKAGEYEFAAGITLPEMVDVLTKGGAGIQYAFTIIEGWNIRDMLKAIRSNDKLVQTLPSENTQAALMEQLGEPDMYPEGLFLPETYYFSKGTTDVEFLRRAREHLKTALAEAWEQRASDIQVKNPYEALILASIVEKETAAPHERPLISGVFTNRLRIGMRLQTDPTVIYGIGERYDGDIRFRDLRTDTPYNTYTRYGLPPTPIAMVGREAIHAALHPEKTKALYFVSRNDGTHIFSNNLKDHEAAVDKYQRSLRKGK